MLEQNTIQNERLHFLYRALLFATDELSAWIQQSFRHYATEESKEQFPEHDLDGNGVLSWEEYNIHSYDRMLNYDENTPLEDEEEESLRQVNIGPLSNSDFMLNTVFKLLLISNVQGY